MGQVLVRNIDDHVIAGLKVKARLAGVSFETFLREQLKAIAPLSGAEKVALLEEFHRKHGPVKLATPTADIIREARDERMNAILGSIDGRR